jgi:hypothetical protein
MPLPKAQLLVNGYSLLEKIRGIAGKKNKTDDDNLVQAGRTYEICIVSRLQHSGQSWAICRRHRGRIGKTGN